MTQLICIECRDLGKKFGRIAALDGLTMDVPCGAVYALLGRNGTGKSTLIQVLMGMLDATHGSVSVLGLDPLTQDVAVKQRVGYIPDRLPMYDWMTVGETIGFVKPFYEGWLKDDEEGLLTRFRLTRQQRVGALSRGNRALLSLVLAMAHRPELVLLDECTSGMDAIARREFERCVIDALQSQGRTVLFAGHQIDEMERICDWVGIIHNGKMLLQMPLEQLKASVKLLVVTSQGPDIPALSGCKVLSRRDAGRDMALIVRLDDPDVLPEMPAGVVLGEALPLTLEEIFVALVESEEGS